MQVLAGAAHRHAWPAILNFSILVHVWLMLTIMAMIMADAKFTCSSRIAHACDSERESTAKFRLALALEFQLRKFCGAELEYATGPHKSPVAQ